MTRIFTRLEFAPIIIDANSLAALRGRQLKLVVGGFLNVLPLFVAAPAAPTGAPERLS